MSSVTVTASTDLRSYIWLLHNLVEASFDLFRNLILGDQLIPWELHPLVSYMSCMIAVHRVALRGVGGMRRRCRVRL